MNRDILRRVDYIFVTIIILLLFVYQDVRAKKAIIVGASSGMGRAVAKLLAEDGYDLGLVARRTHHLESLSSEIPTKGYIKQLDVSRCEESRQKIVELIEEMGGLDLFLITVSACFDNDISSQQGSEAIINVDVKGFWVVADVAARYFEQQGEGHLVGISSVSGLRGEPDCPVYSAAKSFVSTYLEGVRNYYIKNNIPVHVTDIIPGWVDNDHVTFSKMDDTYWVANMETASQAIFDAIKARKKYAYITQRWFWVGLLMQVLPDCVYHWIGGL